MPISALCMTDVRVSAGVTVKKSRGCRASAYSRVCNLQRRVWASMNNSCLFFFFPMLIWGFVANTAYLKDLLFLSFFSCILTYIGFICLKPYPSFLCSFCLSPLFIFYVCWNVSFWGLQYWTSSSTLAELINVGNKSQQSIKDVKTFVPHSWRFFHHMCLVLCFQELFLSHILQSFESLWTGRTQRAFKTPLFLRQWALHCTLQTHHRASTVGLTLNVSEAVSVKIIHSCGALLN